MNSKHASAFALLFLFSASCSKCTKKPLGDADAAADAGAVLVTAVADAAIAAPTPTPPADDAGATAATPEATGTAVAAKGGGGPFAGSYKCNNGLTLTQNGNQVSGSSQTKSSSGGTKTVYTCTVTRADHCEGTAVVTQFFTDTKKPSREIEHRKMNLERREDGVAMKLDRTTETTFCKK